MKEAVQEYLKREKAGHATMKGADIHQILDDVSREFRVDRNDLRAAIVDYTTGGGN